MGHKKLINTTHVDTWPSWLKKKADLTQRIGNDAPIIIRMSESGSEEKLKELIEKEPISEIIDNYDEQLAELFISENAQLYRANPEIKSNSISDFLLSHYGSLEPWQAGSWVYYPWSRQLVHILQEDLFYSLRTIRNKNLITEAEQEAYSQFRVGCLGMSVGSSAAIAIVLQGGSKNIKIADGAVISGSNLNRIRTGVANVGVEKSLVVARQLYEMDPYTNILRVVEPINKESVDSFIDKPWPLDVIVDEIDDLEMKIRLRVVAKRLRIPVLMATDLQDSVMLDVERYDLNPNLELFHGLAGHIEHVLEKKDMSQREWLKYATKIIGTRNVPLRMQKSLLEVGTKLPTQPQLGGTAMMAGSVIAYAVRQLALKENLKSGRIIISLDSFHNDFAKFGYRRAHRKHSKILDRALGSM